MRDLTHDARRVLLCTLAALLATASGCATVEPEPVADRSKKALAHYDLGAYQLSQGRVAMAIRELTTAKELSPDDPWIALALAEAYRRRAKAEEAEAEFREAIRLDPELHTAKLNLAAMYVQLGRFEEAIPLLAELADAATFPSPWRALTTLGWAQYKLERKAEARRSLQLALEYRPDYWPALLNLGILEQEEGRSLEAMRLFELVVEETKRTTAAAEANYRLAEIHVSLGQRRKALDRLTAAVSSEPQGGYWSKRSEEYLELLR